MDRLKLVDAGLRAFDASLPEAVPCLCVATRYRASTCRRCLDVCPGGAIAPTPWLRVDPDHCTACGACGAVCRTGALRFGARTAALRDWISSAAKAGAQTVGIACRFAMPPGEPQAPARLPCLGGLAPADLVAAAAYRMTEIELVAGRCDSCVDRTAGIAVKAAVDTALATLAAVDHALSVTVHEMPVTVRETPAANLAAAPSHALSRRDMFAFVGRGVRRAAAEALAPTKPTVRELHAQAPPPAAHACLIADVRRLAASHEREKTPSAPLWSATITVGRDCDACGLCVRYCPHGALSCATRTVDLRRELCTACGLCEEVCPRGTLIVNEDVLAGAPRSPGGRAAAR